MIRLEGLEGKKRSRDISEEMEALADLNLEKPAESKPSKRRRTAAVWRRIDSSPDWKDEKCQVMDAVLEESSDNSRQSKRRKLTLVAPESLDVPTTKAKPSRPAYKILHPLERLVDNSLQGAAIGSRTVAEHWNLCRNDPSLIENRSKYYTWCNADAGNLLHVCALWNDPETAATALSCLPNEKLVEDMIQALDGEGRTPLAVAHMCGHQQVYEVLEAFGATMGSDDGFVIDVYCLDDDKTTDSRASNDGSFDELGDRVTCELLGGVGYWDETGELVLEIPENGPDNNGVDADARDDDEDSNSENWEGNDYPDSENEDDEYDEDELCFRHYDVDLSTDDFR